jgi:transposase
MEAIVERCCGLDVHQATVVACLLVGEAHHKPKKEIRTYGTTTKDLMELRDWLQDNGCTHVGMESTGVYWKPVYAVLEGSFELIVGNAQHIKNVPGRKTDVKDSEWIAQLVRHGLIAKSFVPPPPIRELRDLTRYHRKLVQSQTAERNRLLKVLETANIKLSSVASDVFGVSGMLMLKALVEGVSSPEQMAQLAKGQLRDKLPQLALALNGRVQEHHRFLLSIQLRRLETVGADINELEARIEQKLEPYRTQQAALRKIPGVGWVMAAVLIAELGVDMSVFLSASHLASWAGVCPGNHQSAGKHKGGKRRTGNVHLTTALVEAALSSSKKKGSYYKDKYHRLKARRGAKRAQMAVGHKILIAAYHILSNKVGYVERGDAYLDQLSKKRVTANLVRRLERLGYEVHIEPKETKAA